MLSRTATVKGEYQRPVHVRIRKYKVFEQIRRSQAAEVGNYAFREWEGSSAASDDSLTLRFRLPDTAARADGSPPANVTFAVTVSDKLTTATGITKSIRRPA